MEPSATKVNIHITELFVTPSTITRDHPFAQFPPPVVFIILFPESLSHLAKQFWQHTGAGISSRFAEHCLTLLNVAFTKLPTESEPPNSHRKSSNASFRDISRLNDSKNETEAAKGDAAFFVEERFGRNLDPTLVREAKLAMRKRIAGVLGDSSSSQIIPLTDRGRDVNEDHVFLFPNGMAAIYFSHKVVSKILPGLKTAQFGYYYYGSFKFPLCRHTENTAKVWLRSFILWSWKRK
jgi:cystathionine gamma-synthase